MNAVAWIPWIQDFESTFDLGSGWDGVREKCIQKTKKAQFNSVQVNSA